VTSRDWKGGGELGQSEASSPTGRNLENQNYTPHPPTPMLPTPSPFSHPFPPALRASSFSTCIYRVRVEYVPQSPLFVQVASSPAAAAAFGELLVDTMWSIDSQLDDVIAHSKAAIAAQSEKENENEQAGGQSEESGALLIRDAATNDKGTLLELVKLFLVR